MRTALTWIILILLSVGGIAGSYALSEAFRSDAREAWEAEASQAAQWLSGTVLGWLEESYAPLSGLAILFENSSEVTAAEFLGATDALEARATAFFVDAKAVARPRANGEEWTIEFSNDPQGPLSPDTTLNRHPEILENIKVAADHPDQVLLGAPFSGEDGSRYSPAALAIHDARGPLIIIGLINYDALAKGLFDIHKLDGLQLQIQGRFKTLAGPGDQREVIGKSIPDALYSVTTRTVSAGADLSITWYMDKQFSKGPQERLTNLTFMGGVAGTILLVSFIGLLLQRNRTITKKIEEATNELTESRQRLALTLASSGIGTWDWNIENDTIFWDEAQHRIMGTDPAEGDLYLARFVKLIHPEDHQRVQSEIKAALASEREYVSEHRFLRPNGDIRTLGARGHVIKDADGRPLRMIGTNMDITERKQAEEELKKLSRAVEQSPASVVITDLKGTIEYVNPKFCEVTGYTADEAIGQNPRILKSDQNPPEVYEELWKSLTTGGEWRGELLNKKKNGELYWEAASISAIQSGDGSISHYLAVKEDITERKKMEADQHERIKELDEAQSAMLNMMEDLDEEKAKAEAATQAKSDFLANMSHEIRTPMNAVIGMAHLALKTELTHKQQDYLNKIQYSANALLGIINDILDFSKIEAGKLDMEAVELDLAETLDNVANVITVKAQEKENLEVLFYLDSQVPNFLVGDPLRLSQILVNLGNNAVKFTEEGEIVLTAKIKKRSEDKVTLQFSMRDTGIGMTAEQQANLFQAFSQADTSTTRKYGGTGLGLTISKRLVNMMGGEIWAESEPGQGTTFSFTADFGLGKETVKRRFVPSPDLRELKVLVVDDNATSREILKDMLESFTFDVTMAASGAEGITELENAPQDQPFELVIIDWKMPGMDGIEASRRIKGHSGLAKIPAIVLVTAYGREEVMQQADQAGLEGFLLKPVNPSVLFDASMQAFGEAIPEKSRAVQRGQKQAEVLQHIQGAHVLLVEDNEINQQVAREILEGAGLKVRLANNGQEAVDAIQKNEYDAVLMDVQMPVMDGYTATKAIRKWEGGMRNKIRKDTDSKSEIRDPKSKIKSLPIIAMTAHAMAGDADKSLAAGMNGHVTKPIDPDQLFATLQKWIQPGRKVLRTPQSEGFEKTDVAAETAPKAEGLPTSLPEFDLQDGLKRLQGNEKLYRKLLLDFGTQYAGTANEIRHALAAKDFKQAHSLVHNLKGLAGNLAATHLQTAAVGLEKLVKGGQQKASSPKKLNQKFADLKQAIDRALRAVQTLGPSVPEKPAKAFSEALSEIPAELARPAAGQMREAAEMGDVTRIKVIAEELNTKSDIFAPISNRFIQLAEDFDFDGILKLVAELEN